MQNIPMVDLPGQYRRIKSEVDQTKQEVLDSCCFIEGEPIKYFAQNLAEFLNVNQVIPCGSGTDALQIALMALDLRPGDEMITTPFTFVATVEVIALLQLKPVFVEVDYDTFNINERLIEDAITEWTKCNISVRLYGQKHEIHILEDKAQAIGAYYRNQNRNTQKAAHFYNKQLNAESNVFIPLEVKYSTHVYYQYTLRLCNIDREKVVKNLKENGIASRVYYPIPLHLQKAYQHYGYNQGDFPVSKQLAKEVLSLLCLLN